MTTPKQNLGSYRFTRSEWREFLSNLREDESGCLLWTGPEHKGYGVFRHKRAHKLYWEFFNGPVPKGKELAHSCNVKRCVRHVRPLTHKENRAEYSGQKLKEYCSKGHKMTKSNTYIPPGNPNNRKCIRCRSER